MKVKNNFIHLFKRLSFKQMYNDVSMSFGEEIKQKQFDSAQQMAHLNIIYTAGWLKAKTKNILKPFGLTQQQFNILKILKGRHPLVCSASDVKKVMIEKLPDLTRMIDRMISKGYVKRDVCLENRRKVDISITPTGLVLIKKVEPVLKKNMIEHCKLTNDEATALSHLLDKMRQV